LENNLDNNQGRKPSLGRVGRPYNWLSIILLISLVAVIVYWPLVYEFAATQINSIRQAVTSASDSDRAPEPAGVDESFSNVMETALRYDREGQRVLAVGLFTQLLRQEARNTSYTVQAAALLPRAAEFFSKGKEIPAEQVEILYQDAYQAILKFYGPDHYDIENVHLGLEKHYSSLGRYREAALQNRRLQDFYRRYHKDNEDLLFNFIQPTTIRLGHTLLSAGQNVEARDVYQEALDMTRAKGRPVSAIEEFIQKTNVEGQTAPDPMTEP
jgi:tetratricopeptide (TPR) repeat protein